MRIMRHMSRKRKAHSTKRVTVTPSQREKRDMKLPPVGDKQRFDQLLDDAVLGVPEKPKQRK